LGRQAARFKDQDPVNIKAAELVGHLHDALEAAGYRGHDLEQFLTRIVFCLFADDTGIFEPKDILDDYLDTHTAPDGSDMGPKLSKLFQVLNTPEAARQSNLDEALARFPYVNGELFAAPLSIPDFDADMRAALLNACRFDWTPISPAIFGSLFQSVMDPKERRAKGAHYTTEKNILKVIGPLFLDDLRAEFERLKALKSGRVQRLRAFHDKLGRLTFFDPACGCGNFLIIAYRELRLLEIEVLRELLDTRQQELDVEIVSQVDVDQFFGIEIEEFPARIAETALWMMDHLMNRQLSDEFGQVFLRIPLKRSPHIHHGDALEMDWAEVLPPERCAFVFGNPPFVGAKYQTPEQRDQVCSIAALGKSGGTLDYVCAWFLKAGDYAVGSTRIAFVATNSVTQGEQVAQLWPLLFERHGLEIAFAHRTFEWSSEARGKAHVHAVILGLDRRENMRPEKRLFSYDDIKGDPEESRHAMLSPYLFDASGLRNPHLVVREESRPINGMKRLVTGVQPLEDGNLTFDVNEREAFLAIEPRAEPLLRPFPGAQEFINSEERWILHIGDTPPNELRNLPKVTERLRRVREFRAKSTRKTTLALANSPSRYGVTMIPEAPFLVVPQVSSERRTYAPIGWLAPPTIPSEKLRVLPDATLTDFALLTSTMHMAWMRAITGRMKSDYMYSVGVVYNTFPLPPANDLSALEPLAQAVRDARRSLRPRPDAAEPAQGTPGARPGSGPALPAQGLRLRPRAGRASLRPLRGDGGTASGQGEGKGEGPGEGACYTPCPGLRSGESVSGKPNGLRGLGERNTVLHPRVTHPLRLQTSGFPPGRFLASAG
ncbi:MAG: hypothetical protein OEM24_11975, partial [Paracoccaceae bacterium]|nr:hypothetical protein [Paracoccaceae bacterium]